MTMNNRPVEDQNLQDGLDEIKAIMHKRGLAGAAMLVAPQESAFVYGMHAPWSAIRADPSTPLGWRIKANSKDPGARERLEGAAHTICQLADFGQQTVSWMEEVLVMLRKSGMQIEHTPFGGQPIRGLMAGKP